MRLWPRNWLHVHDWEKLTDWKPVRYSGALRIGSRPLVGVRCRTPWCRELSLELLQGSYEVSWGGFSGPHPVGYEEAMAELEQKALEES